MSLFATCDAETRSKTSYCTVSSRAPNYKKKEKAGLLIVSSSNLAFTMPPRPFTDSIIIAETGTEFDPPADPPDVEEGRQQRPQTPRKESSSSTPSPAKTPTFRGRIIPQRMRKRQPQEPKGLKSPVKSPRRQQPPARSTIGNKSLETRQHNEQKQHTLPQDPNGMFLIDRNNSLIDPPPQIQSIEEKRDQNEDNERGIMSPKSSSKPLAIQSILKKEPLDHDNEHKDESENKSKDLLNYIFDNAQGVVCREKNQLSPPSPQEDSTLDDSATDTSSPIRLHSLANPEGEQEIDTLDILCNGAETFLCKETSAEAIQQQETSRTLEALRIEARSHSLLDSAASKEEKDARLERIRQKKRLIEQQIRSSSNEPGFLVPRAYKSKNIPSNAITNSQSQEGQSKYIKQVLVGLVVFLVSAAVVLVAVSFFWPTEKL